MIFIDTSVIVAYSNETDSLHEHGLKVFKDIDDGKYGMPVMTDYIFDEAMTVMLVRTKNLQKTIATGEKLLDAVLMLRIDSGLFESSWNTFKSQQKHNLSFTDCSIVATCEANGVATIATFDKPIAELNKFVIVNK